MDWKIVVTALLVTTSATPGVLHAPPNDPPEADAGLDQQVPVGSTVLLDATGSYDPDGTIDDYDWQIETPAGDTVEPACPTCARTRFPATAEGTYNVTLTVTDDDGATRTDSLYVSATPDDGPTVDLTGPTETTPETPETFRANPTAGSEPIVAVDWTVDATSLPVENTTTVTRQFESLGPRTVTVTVTDAIGRTSSASIQVTVDETTTTPPSDDGNGTDPDDPGEVIVDPKPGNGTAPDGPPDGTDPTPGAGNEPIGGTLAGEYDPTITGPQLVTGDEPLEAEYAIDVDANPENVTRVRWFVDDEPVATSPGIDVTWTPGRHTLRANVTYTDDSTDTATFEDGSTTVVADPAPELTLDEPAVERGNLSGAFDVTDDYGNIETLTLTVENTTLVDLQYPSTRRLQPFNVKDTYQYDDPDPTRNHTITLTSTDAAGQTRTITRTVQPNTGPEILSIGFTNDPVDSYHPRIKSERYTATHVVKIDLNGIDDEKITIENFGKSRRAYELSEIKRTYNKKEDVLTITSFWAGEFPGEYKITSVLGVSDESLDDYNSTFRVTSSPPELRLTSPKEGTKRIVQNWGMIIDASASFDPDNHELILKWLNGAVPLENREWTAKLTPTETAGVRLTDETGAYKEELGSFLPYYVPRISNITQKTTGPYNESEEVTLKVWTDPYAFTKNTNRYNISLDARSNSSDVDILSVGKRKVPTESVEGNNAIKHRLHRWVATVRVSASDLNEGEDWITFYNEENPERIYVSEELGDVEVQFESKKQDLVIRRTSYRVRNESGEDRIQVTDESRYERLVRDDWELVDKRQAVDTVSIQTLETETDTVTRSKSFETGADARRFAATQRDWSYAGKESYEQTETVVVTKWTSDPNAGRPTGETRQAVSNPNEYVTLHEFRHTTTKEVTETREVTKRVPITVEVERTVEAEVCRPYIGCLDQAKTVTFERTKLDERTVTVERDLTRQIEHTYWARRAKSPSHSNTGSTKQVRTEPKRYHTEYLANVPVKRTETKHRYVVSKSIQKSREDWTHMTEVDSLPEARALAGADTQRIGFIEKDTEWILAKSMNTTEVVRTYDDEENVLKTFATVTGTLIYGPDPDQRTEFTINIEMEGHATNEELLDEVEEMDIDCNSDTGVCDG